MTPKQKWETIPELTRERILRNVWCGHCSDVVKFADYRVYSAGRDVVLRGTCAVCHEPIARVVEGDTLQQG